MTKLMRLFATCLLVVSISAATFADGSGGSTQGPPAPSPDYTTDQSNDSASEPVQDPSFDVPAAEDTLVDWLVAVLF
jgi:hypothetical protein